MESGPSVTLDPYDEDFKKVPILSDQFRFFNLI